MSETFKHSNKNCALHHSYVLGVHFYIPDWVLRCNVSWFLISGKMFALDILNANIDLYVSNVYNIKIVQH